MARKEEYRNKHPMIGLCLFTLLITSYQSSKTLVRSYTDYPGTDSNLWLQYSRQSTLFRIWSPTAEMVYLKLYKEGTGDELKATNKMQPKSNGVWELKLDGDLNGVYYTYQVETAEGLLEETAGIYAQAVGLNGQRAMVLDLERTNPAGWDQDKGPTLKLPNEAIIYETHVRDLTVSKVSGIQQKGKYLGVAEKGTKGPAAVATGLDHIKEMGFTHVHLLPTSDFTYLDEAKLDSPQYNWGYSPQNYNAPEGSYSTNPASADARIREFKSMVKSFHDYNIGVILDVVYNHTGTYKNSNFNLEVPGYYYRHLPDGSPSNATACGNEIASEKTMARKYIVESVAYWAKEYHVDGFRFDLMAVLDVQTMNEIADTLKKINPNILLYGEGWAPGDSPYPWKKRAFKFNIPQMPFFSAFSDEIRDGLKGSVFETMDPGFVSGGKNREESVKMGIVGCIQHPQIDNSQVNASKDPWTTNPWQSIVYVSCHDNLTLYDKLRLSQPAATEAEITAMDQLAAAVVLTSQGTAFVHAGAEMLRSKKGVENSYESPDSINEIDWNGKVQHAQTVSYYKNLIQLRKQHPAFRMKTGDEVRKNLEFKTTEDGLIAYQISHHANGDAWKNIYVVYNARPVPVRRSLAGKWTIAVRGDDFKVNKAIEEMVEVPARSMLIAFQE